MQTSTDRDMSLLKGARARRRNRVIQKLHIVVPGSNHDTTAAATSPQTSPTRATVPAPAPPATSQTSQTFWRSEWRDWVRQSTVTAVALATTASARAGREAGMPVTSTSLSTHTLPSATTLIHAVHTAVLSDDNSHWDWLRCVVSSVVLSVSGS